MDGVAGAQAARKGIGQSPGNLVIMTTVIAATITRIHGRLGLLGRTVSPESGWCLGFSEPLRLVWCATIFPLTVPISFAVIKLTSGPLEVPSFTPFFSFFLLLHISFLINHPPLIFDNYNNGKSTGSHWTFLFTTPRHKRRDHIRRASRSFRFRLEPNQCP